MEIQKSVKLNNGVDMPLFGFGTFQIPDGDICAASTKTALKNGYRMIDTASMYKNESSVGNAVKAVCSKCGLKREDIFITTKIWISDYEEDKTIRSFKDSLEKLGTDYIDLLLLHQPFGNWKQSYRTLEELYRKGKIRAIGICNFVPEKLDELLEFAGIIPMVNQIELHPYFSQEKYCSDMKNKGIHPEAWGPLAEGLEGLLKDPVILKTAEDHGKTAAQVILRYNVQRGVSVIPRSTREDHIIENTQIWDFSLSDDEMDTIGNMSADRSNIVDFYDPKIEKLFAKLK